MIRKISCILLVTGVICFFAQSTPVNGMEKSERIQIQSICGNFFSADTKDKAYLSGVFEQGAYCTKIRIELRGEHEEKEVIVPEIDSGYNPHIQACSFDGALDQIFYGADSGGSGGYGYYFIYEASGKKELYSSQTSRAAYRAYYADGFQVHVENVETGSVTVIDLSAREKEYLYKIYTPEGKLKEPSQCDIGSANEVLPFYNGFMDRCAIEIYFRITGLYNADTLGYVILRQRFSETKFESFYEMVAIPSSFSEKMEKIVSF